MVITPHETIRLMVGNNGVIERLGSCRRLGDSFCDFPHVGYYPPAGTRPWES
jgi:hypothetical protein